MLSISTSYNYGIPIEAQIPAIARAGFTHVSLGGRAEHSGYLRPAARQRLKALIAAHGLRVDTVHGPSVGGPGGTQALTEAAEAAADLGASVVVLHGGPFAFDAADLSLHLHTLLGICQEMDSLSQRLGVVFALENVMPGPATDLVRRALPELPRRRFGFCYDSAHDQIDGPRAFDLLEELGDRVIAVHLSDRVRPFVDHVVPGEGFIDWEALCRALRRTSFRGPLLLEVMATHSRVREPDALLALAYERGRWLADRVWGSPEEADGQDHRG